MHTTAQSAKYYSNTVISHTQWHRDKAIGAVVILYVTQSIDWAWFYVYANTI